MYPNEGEQKKKRVFEVLDEMNVLDGLNKTQLVWVCPDFISADKVKAGAKICMGAPEESLNKIMNDEYMPILLLVNKSEYFQRMKENSEK